MADRKQGAGWSSGSSAAGHKAHWFIWFNCFIASRSLDLNATDIFWQIVNDLLRALKLGRTTSTPETLVWKITVKCAEMGLWTDAENGLEYGWVDCIFMALLLIEWTCWVLIADSWLEWFDCLIRTCSSCQNIPDLKHFFLKRPLTLNCFLLIS